MFSSVRYAKQYGTYMLKKLIHESVFHVNNSCGLVEILSFIIFQICLQDHDVLIKKLSVSTIARFYCHDHSKHKLGGLLFLSKLNMKA